MFQVATGWFTTKTLPQSRAYLKVKTNQNAFQKMLSTVSMIHPQRFLHRSVTLYPPLSPPSLHRRLHHPHYCIRNRQHACYNQKKDYGMASLSTSTAAANKTTTTTISKSTLDTRRRNSQHYHTKDDNIEIIDTLIIGGGPMGSSTAFHLAQLLNNNNDTRNHHRIVVLEQDPTYQSASATVSAGGIRQHFSLKENVQMSMYGRDFLRQAKELLATTNQTNHDDDNNKNINNNRHDPVDVQFVEHGYLFLATTPQGKNNMVQSNAVQRQAGCDTTKLMTNEELSMQFPWLNTDDVLLGSYGTSGEGWFDPWGLLKGFYNKNQELGVEYWNGRPIQANRDDETGEIVSVDLQIQPKSSQSKEQTTTPSSSSSSSSFVLKTVHVKNIVNAAGAYARSLMDLLAGPKRPLQYPLPVMPRKRCIFYFHCSSSDNNIVPEIAPLTVDSSGVYFRSEGAPGKGTFICGVSPPCDIDSDYCIAWDDNDNIDDDDDDNHHHHRTSHNNKKSFLYDVTSEDYQMLFEDCIWPSMYHRVPAFGNIKVLNQWAGLYEYNVIDQNAIIDFHPEMTNVLMVNGFSGHGLQQSPAAGRAAAELLYYSNQFQSLDLSIFRFDRCMMIKDKENKLSSFSSQSINRPPPVFERAIV